MRQRSTLSFLAILWVCLAQGDGTAGRGKVGVVEYSMTNRKTPPSDLQCLHCYNGDDTNDCITLHNISSIPTRVCKPEETFCKVERIHTNGYLTTFDRYCSSNCKPGCLKASDYEYCVSCCNHAHLCNTDNGADTPTAVYNRRYGLAFLLVHCVISLAL